MENIKQYLLEYKLKESGFSENDVHKIIEIIKQLRCERNRKTSNTLREKAANGLKCGRPSFNKPHFFRLLCIYFKLGYIDIKEICNMFKIGRTTFFKYMRLEDISIDEIKNNGYKKPNKKQIDLFSEKAETIVNNWILKNKIKFQKDKIVDLKNDCLLSIFLKLPTFNYDFDDFCFKICYETYYCLKERYFATESKDVQFSEEWQFDKAVKWER